jgi:hypothetical protein
VALVPLISDVPLSAGAGQPRPGALSPGHEYRLRTTGELISDALARDQARRHERRALEAWRLARHLAHERRMSPYRQRLTAAT